MGRSNNRCPQIGDYLNQGGVYKWPKNIKKSPITIYTESTQIRQLKVCSQQKLVSQSISFKHIDEAVDAHLVQKLLISLCERNFLR